MFVRRMGLLVIGLAIVSMLLFCFGVNTPGLTWVDAWRTDAGWMLRIAILFVAMGVVYACDERKLKQFVAVRHQEQRHGWEVLLDGNVVFRLRYSDYYPPFYDFTIEDIACPPETLAQILNSSTRTPLENVVYRNRETGATVEDKYFYGQMHGNIASFRDWRPIPQSRFWRWVNGFLSWVGEPK